MPSSGNTRTRRVCNRCRRTVPPGPCPHCVPQGRADADRLRPTAHARGYDRRWQATRRAYLNEYPFCQCNQYRCPHGCDWTPPGHGAVLPLAEHVHHIDNLGPHGPHGHDWDNLMGLTQTCHSQVTLHEDRHHHNGD